MARAVTTRHKTIATTVAWIVALLIFFPILYTIITSFKSEQEAIQGFSLIPSGTIESYAAVQAQSGIALDRAGRDQAEALDRLLLRLERGDDRVEDRKEDQ